MNLNNQIDWSDTDRIVSNDTRYVQLAGDWWRETSSWQTRQNGSPGLTLMGRTRTRLTGLGRARSPSAPQALLVAESHSYDARDNATLVCIYLDRATHTTTRTTDGYRFIYTFAPIEWDQIRVLHEKSIHLVLKELEDETLKRPSRIGLSVDEEKSEKVCCEFYREVEASIPDYVLRLLARGNNKVAFDILKLLVEGAKRPKELRAALGIASVYFYL